MKILVGNTGFVGSNLKHQTHFDALYNSANIQASFGSKPELLVYAGIYSRKFLANQFPEEDNNHTLQAIDNIRKINPGKIVLISTIDVLSETVGADETSISEENHVQPYGLHRLKVEQWVQSNIPEHLIVRLPAIYGQNIKKNFIYDIICKIPAMLNEAHYNKLKTVSDRASEFYHRDIKGYYHLNNLTGKAKDDLMFFLNQLNFNATHFTDSRSVFQFYPLAYLWQHIETALQHPIKLLHLATEPVSAEALYRHVTGESFVNEIHSAPPVYNFRSLHAELFGGRDGYIFTRDFILDDIRQFIHNYP